MDDGRQRLKRRVTTNRYGHVIARDMTSHSLRHKLTRLVLYGPLIKIQEYRSQTYIIEKIGNVFDMRFTCSTFHE